MAIVRQYAGQVVVRVGLTQFPAGVGVKEPADLKQALAMPAKNLHKGTAMFAKVLRIVAKCSGNPTNKDIFPQIFEDANSKHCPHRKTAYSATLQKSGKQVSL